jgi:hypothetical protein
MTSKFFFAFFVAFSVVTAQASPVAPAPVEPASPALQLARRVASMENNKDLPSRAVWLSKQVAAKTRLAYQTQVKPKGSKKKSAPVAN